MKGRSACLESFPNMIALAASDQIYEIELAAAIEYTEGALWSFLSRNKTRNMIKSKNQKSKPKIWQEKTKS